MTNANPLTTCSSTNSSAASVSERTRPRTHSSRAWQARLILLLSLLLCGLSSRSFAAADSKGTDFWLTFPGNYTPGSTTLTMFITGDVATTGVVSVASLGFTAPFTVTPGVVTSVVVPAGVEVFASDVVANNGIHITSGQEVTVYGLSRQQYTTDTYLALPTDVLGTQYIVLGYLNATASDLLGTQFAIVGTVNGTSVTITPTLTVGTRVANVPYTITLNQGQTYLLRSAGPYPSDLSGTIISTTQSVAVFGSHRCANVPHDHSACDYLAEQLPPTTTWGKQFVSVPLKTRLNGDTFRFLASTNNTEVRVNGTLVATLNRGQYVAVPNVTPTTASISFAGSSTASGGYTVSYTPSGGAAQTVQANASPVALTGLLPNTTYAVTVTSNCAGTQTATSTPAVSFTTAITPPVCNRNVNQPVATPDHLVAATGPLTFTAAQLLANDTDPRNRTLRVASVGEPSTGQLVTNADGTYTYTAPWPSYTGPVTFSYVIEGTGPVIASSGTYHYYEFVSAPGTCWTDAKAAAAARTYEGMQGYLATITFAGEKEFLAGRTTGQYWIGAADDAVEGEWRWKTGPKAGQLFWRGAADGIGLAYANWSPGEPDNFHNFGHPEGESYGIFYGNSGYWNDLNNCNIAGTTAGYLVEYGGLEPCIPILYSLGTVTINVGTTTQQEVKATAFAASRTAAAAGEQALQVMPNPSTGQFRVQVMPDLAGPAQLDLFDMQGRLVRSLFTGNLPADELHEIAVDAPALSAGIYVVRLQRGQQVQHLRMLIQK